MVAQAAFHVKYPTIGTENEELCLAYLTSKMADRSASIKNIYLTSSM